MKNFSKVTQAAVDILNSDIDVTNIFGGNIERSQYVNQRPEDAPWCGVYRGKVAIDPRTLGGVDNWEYKPILRVIVQASSTESGDECEDLLEDYTKKIIAALTADLTIGGTVDMITGIIVEPLYNEDVRETTFFQANIIEFILEVSTS